MTWYSGLTFRSQKSIKTKGELYKKCLNAYRSKTKDSVHSRTIADRIEVSAARFSTFLSGDWEDMPDQSFLTALEYIKMPYEEFKLLAKKSAIPKMGMYAPDFALPLTAAPPNPTATSHPESKPMPPTATIMKSRIPATPKPRPAPAEKVKAKAVRIKNHVLEGFLAMVDADGVIHLYENTPTIAKVLKKVKWAYVAPADEVGGEIVARISTI